MTLPGALDKYTVKTPTWNSSGELSKPIVDPAWTSATFVDPALAPPVAQRRSVEPTQIGELPLELARTYSQGWELEGWEGDGLDQID